MTYKFTVLSSEQGMRLLQFLRDHLSSYSSVKGLKRAIEKRGCKINGRIETFSTAILKKGDVVELSLKEEKQLPFGLLVLYEDEDLLICNKPAGLVSDNKAFNDRMPAYKGSLLLAHRLDKETSGAIILAKSEQMKKALTQLFAKREVEKTYLAIVDGVVLKQSGDIDTFLAPKQSYEGQTIYGSAGKGDRAITHWECLKRGLNSSLILCKPVTGRTHQLRVHLKEIGHPILGDSQYSRSFSCPFHAQRHLLHAHTVAFIHPLNQEKITATAPIPDDFIEAQEALELLI
jgi:23S rRNA pseudouridine955/2504/2580 synthase/23S rRNA pseudouridine1911/1915/1917 synthase